MYSKALKTLLRTKCEKNEDKQMLLFFCLLFEDKKTVVFVKCCDNSKDRPICILSISSWVFIMPRHQKSGGVLCYTLWNFECPSIHLSVCLSVHPSVRQHPHHSSARNSFSNFTGAFRMVWRYAYCFFRILKLFFITFFAFLTRLFSSPNTTEMYREYVPSARNSSYSFRPILFKLYRPF